MIHVIDEPGTWDADILPAIPPAARPANLTATALLGVGRSTLVKQPFSRFILKEDQDVFYLLKNEPSETASPACDLRMLKPDGTPFWAHLKIFSATDESGEPLCRIVLSDISWRKQAEEDVRSLNAELRASEERLHELNALGELLLLPNSIEKKFKHITETVVRVFGADFARIWIIKPGDRCNTGCVHAQEVEGPHVCRFRDKCLHLLASSGRYTHTDGGAHARVPFGCYKIGKIATGEEAGFLTNEVTTDPRVHDHAWAQELGLKAFAGYCLIDATSTPVGVMALFSKQAISKNQDLLLRGFAHLAALTLIAARSEEALRRNEIAVEQSGDGIAIADTNGTLVFLNTAWARMHGYEPTEMIGQPLSINHTPEQLEREVIPFNDAVREKGSHSSSTELSRSPSGETPNGRGMPESSFGGDLRRLAMSGFYVPGDGPAIAGFRDFVLSRVAGRTVNCRHDHRTDPRA